MENKTTEYQQTPLFSEMVYSSKDMMDDPTNNNETPYHQGPPKPKNFEDLLEQIGGFGRFQVMILVFILFFEIPAALLAFSPVFVASVPKQWACTSDNDTVYLSAEDICECNATKYSPPHSIVSEWELICDSSWAADAITSIQMFGMFFGNTIPSQLSDWYGRKYTFIGLIFTMAIGQAASALATNPYVFAAARFICGIGLAGYLSLNGLYTMEFLTPKWRQLGGCLGPLGEGIILLGVMAYLIKPWRLLVWATTLPFITIIFILPLVPESPRWLLRNKKLEEAEEVLRYIANVNKRRPVDMQTIELIAQSEGPSETVKYSYLDLFRRKEVRGKTLIFIGIWFCWAFTYFGLSFNIRNFGVDPYLMLILMGVVDCIGFRAALLINNRMGRRKALIVFTSISAIFFLPIAIVQMAFDTEEYKNLLITFVLLGKLAVAGARSSVRCLTVESYPISIRTMGFGVSRVSATLGGIAAPQVAYIGSKWPSIPMFSFALLGILGSLLSLLLKETSGKPLEDGITAAGNKGQVAPAEMRYQVKSGMPASKSFGRPSSLLQMLRARRAHGNFDIPSDLEVNENVLIL